MSAIRLLRWEMVLIQKVTTPMHATHNIKANLSLWICCSECYKHQQMYPFCDCYYFSMLYYFKLMLLIAFHLSCSLSLTSFLSFLFSFSLYSIIHHHGGKEASSSSKISGCWWWRMWQNMLTICLYRTRISRGKIYVHVYRGNVRIRAKSAAYLKRFRVFIALHPNCISILCCRSGFGWSHRAIGIVGYSRYIKEFSTISTWIIYIYKLFI